jgi:hypothetical protein
MEYDPALKSLHCDPRFIKIHIDSAAFTDRPSLNLRQETGAGLRP